MEPYLEFFIGQPVGDPLELAETFFENAEITKATSEKIVLRDESGGKVVFFGDFVIDGKEVTGTMTGFKYKDDGIKLIEGDGYEIDAAELIGALGGGGGGSSISLVPGETASLFNIFAPDGILIKGSDLGDEIIRLNADDAEVLGRKGDDVLVGGEGNQVLKGGKGNDSLQGRGDKDTLKGGEGNDMFIFSFSASGPEAVETPVAHKIRDFSHEDDTIGLAIGKIGFGYLDGDLFKKGTEATSEDHRIIYDKDTGKLYFDEDGSGDLDAIHFGSVKAGTKIKVSNFFGVDDDFAT